jgi:signal peptidase II
MDPVNKGGLPDMSDTQKALVQSASRWSTLVWFAIAAVVVFADMETKRWASDSLELYRPQELLSWFNLTLAHNYGAAFSFLSDAGGWQRWLFMVLAGSVTLVLFVWLVRLPRGEWRTGLALGLIIGGAVGNLVDRVRLGYVVDFIDVHYGGWHWPAFNIADSAITCGVILLLLDALLLSLSGQNKEDA